MSEYFTPPVTEVSSEEGLKDNPKSKSKKKAIGAFAVEAQPTKASESIWALDTPSSKTKATESKKNNKIEQPEKNALPNDLPEALGDDETSIINKQLATARREQMQQDAVTPDELELAENAAVTRYLAKTEASGDAENAYLEVVQELEVGGEAKAPARADNSTLETESSNSPEGPLSQGEERTVTSQVNLSHELQLQAGGGNRGNTPRPPHPPSGPPVGPNQEPFHNSSEFNNHYTPEAPGPRPAERVSVPLAEAIASERRAAADGLIVGAVVGYLFGRRRGRIKTEKRLAPIQRKLEKQVQHLQTEMAVKETLIRQTVRQQRQAKERPGLGRARSYESPLNHPPVRPERIGHVLVNASARTENGPIVEAKVSTPSGGEISAKKRSETMSRTELLALSEKVVVDGTTLRQIYETQLVSEKGLRRLMAEHLRGGNVSRALRRELIERQIDFERDPIMRDKSHAGSADQAAKTVLTELLKQAGAPTEAQTQPLGGAIQKNQAAARDARRQTKRRQQVIMDTSLITFIVVLIVLITAIIMRG